MASTRITPHGWTVELRYNDERAELLISHDGRLAVYDEDDCDKLLRLIECSGDPYEELVEFFADEFPGRAFRVAVQFVDHARDIARFVYADVA